MGTPNVSSIRKRLTGPAAQPTASYLERRCPPSNRGGKVGVGPRSRSFAAGYRALLAVPLVREDPVLGGLTVIRKATGAFAPEIIELLRTFATQSALAIQNARLFGASVQRPQAATFHRVFGAREHRGVSRKYPCSFTLSARSWTARESGTSPPAKATTFS